MSKLAKLEKELEEAKAFGRTIQENLLQLLKNGDIYFTDEHNKEMISWFRDHGFRLTDTTVEEKYGHYESDVSATKIEFNFDIEGLDVRQHILGQRVLKYDSETIAVMLTSKDKKVRQYAERIKKR